MGLLGALVKLQKMGAGLYLQMSQFFGENGVVRAGWIEMGRDLEQQSCSLKNLPSGFWNNLKADDATLKAALELCSSKSSSNNADRSLNGCFRAALDFEEPLILRTYVPLIRVLRLESSTNRGLDFYIQVKAHVARLTRLVEPFSSDPAVVQRAHSLLERFEREVQAPIAEVTMARSVPKRPRRLRHAPAGASKPIHARARTKRLVKKLELPRRQAQR